MNRCGSEGEQLEETERKENLDSNLEEPERDSEPRDEDMEEDDNEGDDSTEEVDTPRASLPPSKKKVMKRKRKRSSSEESSAADMNPDSGGAAKGPLSNTNKSINVGDEYQAVIEEQVDFSKYMEDNQEDSELLVWEPPQNMDIEEVIKSVKEVSDRYLVPVDKVLFLLRNNNFDVTETISKIKNACELVDGWLDEERYILENTFQHVGKNFHHVHAAIAHRSLRSIIKYYYSEKKNITYRKFAEKCRTDLNSAEEVEDYPETYPDDMFNSMCENCGEKAERMEINQQMNRAECRACLIYFELMGVPRPTSLRLVLSERIQNNVICPDPLRTLMKDFKLMMEPATGKTFESRAMGDQTTSDYLLAAYPQLRGHSGIRSKEKRPTGVKEIEYDPPVISAELKEYVIASLQLLAKEEARLEAERAAGVSQSSEVKIDEDPMEEMNESKNSDSSESNTEEVKTEDVEASEEPGEMTSDFSNNSSDKIASDGCLEMDTTALSSDVTEEEIQQTSISSSEVNNSSVDPESAVAEKESHKSTEYITNGVSVQSLESSEPLPAPVQPSKETPEKSNRMDTSEQESTSSSNPSIELPSSAPTDPNPITNGLSSDLPINCPKSEAKTDDDLTGLILPPLPQKENPSTSDESLGAKPNPSVYIWHNRRKTVCMEENEILADDARRRMFEACQYTSRVDSKEVATLKNDMKSLWDRMERSNFDIDLNPSFIFSNERVHYEQPWTEEEQEEVMRCFHWYGPNFNQIADIMGTKSADQVYKMYCKNQRAIDVSHHSYQSHILPMVARADQKKQEWEESRRAPQ